MGPSGSKFGVEVPATNTVAVKCFTKCGFTIARIDQSNEPKYKMTIENVFNNSQYQSFLNNSIVIPNKVEMIANKDKEDDATNTNINRSDVVIKVHDDDDDDDEEEEEDDYH